MSELLGTNIGLQSKWGFSMKISHISVYPGLSPTQKFASTPCRVTVLVQKTKQNITSFFLQKCLPNNFDFTVSLVKNINEFRGPLALWPTNPNIESCIVDGLIPLNFGN